MDIIKRQFFDDDCVGKPYFGDNDSEDVVSQNFKLKTQQRKLERKREKNTRNTFCENWFIIKPDMMERKRYLAGGLSAPSDMIYKRKEQFIKLPGKDRKKMSKQSLDRGENKEGYMTKTATIQRDLFSIHTVHYSVEHAKYDCKHHENNFVVEKVGSAAIERERSAKVAAESEPLFIEEQATEKIPFLEMVEPKWW